jgi:hypothetical protein
VPELLGHDSVVIGYSVVRASLILSTIEMDFPWGTLRSRFGSKIKLVRNP